MSPHIFAFFPEQTSTSRNSSNRTLTHVDTFFVDCGADDLFVDSKLAADLHIPLVKLSTPIQLRLADGDSSSVISHRTWTLTLHTAWKIAVLDLLEFKGWENPQIQINVFPPTVVSDTSKSLAQLNPISGDCSLASILSLDSIQEGVYPFVEASPLSESGVPADILSQFESVFSKDLAETLPPHRDFDCSIELIRVVYPHMARYTISPVRKTR
ncbi:hypothetical protein BASA83_013532 [Batrachochytrium salamandrivorans]|nr:hypothetical protein BASA83_013532 [Batrachochytrium salamandrivorans]